MHEQHEIVNLIHAAKTDTQAADALIEKYMGFIRSETAKFIHRFPQDGMDDELSIAMFAFYESILGYDVKKGNFLSLAARNIKNRLIDHYRKEKRHSSSISLYEPAGDDDGHTTLLDKIEDTHNDVETFHHRTAAAEEIEEYGKQLQNFGISFSDVADNCPKQERTLQACGKILAYAKSHSAVLSAVAQTGKLPIAELFDNTGVEKKTLERHRKYLVAILIAYTNGYEIIRGHLCKISPDRKGGDSQ